MIENRKKLKEYLSEEKKIYIPQSKIKALEKYLMGEPECHIWHFVKMLRLMEYYHSKKNLFHQIMYIICRRKKNKLGIKLGIEMWDKSFDKGLYIAHGGAVVVNGYARIGKNCILHGNNCIGNDGIDISKAPRLGDNVRVGVGAKIIGDVEIANNVKIAAGAVVVHSFLEEGVTIAGIPAHIVKRME